MTMSKQTQQHLERALDELRHAENALVDDPANVAALVSAACAENPTAAQRTTAVRVESDFESIQESIRAVEGARARVVAEAGDGNSRVIPAAGIARGDRMIAPDGRPGEAVWDLTRRSGVVDLYVIGRDGVAYTVDSDELVEIAT